MAPAHSAKTAPARSSSPTAILWFRNDLRLNDNPALAAAVASGKRIVALYILDDDAPGPWRRGAASRWYLHHSLAALATALEKRGASLLLRRGHSDLVLPGVVAESGADAIYCNRSFEPWAIRLEQHLETHFGASVALHRFNGSLLFEPSEIRTGAGKPFQVFSPFWRACLAAPEPEAPRPFKGRLAAAPPLKGDSLADWRLTPRKPDWAAGLRESWDCGEDAARRRLKIFAERHAADYGSARNFLAAEGVSRLSPALHFGEVSPREIWRAVRDHAAEAALPYLRELGWREFCHHLLLEHPTLPEEPLDSRFKAFPWRNEAADLEAWRKGRTGYPVVDAAMRQLWSTGWMHNRARLITASFLIKDLLAPWQDGERWFWDTLVDADLADNSANWQWVAGCGADAAPYFRVFNPVLQGEKFDPDGDYVRRYVPELEGLPARWIHRPWDAPEEELGKAGVRLGETYPHRIVDHFPARDRALAAFESIKAA